MVLELRQMIWTIPTTGFKNYFETNGHFGYFGPSPVLPTWSEKYFSASSFSFSFSLSLSHTHTQLHMPSFHQAIEDKDKASLDF